MIRNYKYNETNIFQLNVIFFSATYLAYSIAVTIRKENVYSTLTIHHYSNDFSCNLPRFAVNLKCVLQVRLSNNIAAELLNTATSSPEEYFFFSRTNIHDSL
jgi:hypothetical protein